MGGKNDQNDYPQFLEADVERPSGHENVEHQDGETDQDDANFGRA